MSDMRTEQNGALVTSCSSAHCYNQASVTGDPAKPPFCAECSERWEKAHQPRAQKAE